MVQLQVSTPPIDPSASVSSETDYSDNPTPLFKYIEAKEWEMAKARVAENPEEVSSWIKRSGKDGKLRWKILPLHAVICMKAPTDLVIPILNAYPEACSLADDQGMLPLHLIMKNEDADEEVLKLIIKSNPSGVNAKDKEGKLPLGRPVLLALNMLQEMEREKIKSDERTQFESTLDKECESKDTEIKKLKEEISLLKDLTVPMEEELELRLTSTFENFENEQKFKTMEKINEKQHEQIDSQNNELVLKEEQLAAALAKLASQEEYIVKYREMNKNDVCELGNALSNINDLNTKIFLLQAQLDTQAGELKRKEECESSSENKSALFAELEKIKSMCDIGDIKRSMTSKLTEASTSVKSCYRESLDTLTELVNKIVAQFKNHIEKIKAIKMFTGQQEDTQEEKEEELEAAKSRYQEFLEKITKLINDIIVQFNEHMKKIRDKSSEMHASLVEKKNVGLENFNNKIRELFEKIVNCTVEPFKNICKDRGQKDHALLTSEADEYEKEDEITKEIESVKEDVSANVGDVVKSDYGVGFLKENRADATDVIEISEWELAGGQKITAYLRKDSYQKSCEKEEKSEEIESEKDVSANVDDTVSGN